MNTKDLEKVLDRLANEHARKRDELLIKARAEIETIEREYTAYYSGAFDAVKAVSALLKAEQAKEADDGGD